MSEEEGKNILADISNNAGNRKRDFRGDKLVPSASNYRSGGNAAIVNNYIKNETNISGLKKSTIHIGTQNIQSSPTVEQEKTFGKYLMQLKENLKKLTDFDENGDMVKNEKGKVVCCEMVKSELYKSNSHTECQVELQDLLDDDYLAFHGALGIGKSTALKLLIAKLIAPSSMDIESSVQRDIVLYFKPRWNPSDKITLREFVTSYQNYHAREDECEIISSYLRDNSNRILICFDGLDEYSGNLSELETSGGGKQSVNSWIQLILSKQLFPQSKIIVTSQDQKLIQLAKDLRPKETVQVLGFSEEIVSSTTRSMNISLLRNAGCKSLLKPPLILSKNFVKMFAERQNIGVTCTEFLLYVFNVARLRPHFLSKSREYKKSLFKFAFEAPEDPVPQTSIPLDLTVQDLCRFTQPHIRNYRHQPNVFLDKDLQFTFCHKLLKELLAAIHILQMDLPEFVKIVKGFTTNNFSIQPRVKLLHGLACTNLLESDDCSWIKQDINDLDSKRLFLWDKFLSKIPDKVLHKDFSIVPCILEISRSDLVRKMSEIKLNKESFNEEQFLYWSELIALRLSLNQDRKFSETEHEEIGTLTSSQFSANNEKSVGILMLNFTNCDVQPHHLTILLESIKTRTRNTVTDLILDENHSVVSKQLAELLCHVKIVALVLQRCNIPTNKWQELLCGCQDQASKINRLLLNGTTVEFNILSKIVDRFQIRCLEIDHSNFNMEEFKQSFSQNTDLKIFVRGVRRPLEEFGKIKIYFIE